MKVGIENINKTKMNILNCLMILCRKATMRTANSLKKNLLEGIEHFKRRRKRNASISEIDNEEYQDRGRNTSISEVDNEEDLLHDKLVLRRIRSRRPPYDPHTPRRYSLAVVEGMAVATLRKA